MRRKCLKSGLKRLKEPISKGLGLVLVLLMIISGFSADLLVAAAQPKAASEVTEPDNKTDQTKSKTTADKTEVLDFDQMPADLEAQWQEKQVLESTNTKRLFRGNYVLKKLRERLLFSNESYENLEKEINRVKNKLLFSDLDLQTLNDQITLLSRQIISTKRKIKRTEEKITETKARMANLYQKIDISEVNLAEQKNQLADYLRLIYMHENFFYSPAPENNKKVNLLKFLLASSTVSETLQRETYLKILEKGEKELIQELEVAKVELELEKDTLNEERIRLEYLKIDLDEEKTNLDAQRTGKKRLLEETKGKEEIFQKLLAESIAHQEEVLKEINAMRTNIDYFNEQLGALKGQITQEDYEIVLRIKEQSVNGQRIVGETLKFPIWPVRPSRGLSAYFVDAGYRRAFGVEHYAIDVPIPQKTPVLAPANGLVVKMRDMDTGYNYIAVAHEKGVMTVVGHIFESMVDVGDFVHVGDVLGLSGGVPGTRGAGYRTTGAHLHFEVWQDGVRVNPLGYMNLESLPEEYIPQEYLEKLDEKFGDVVDEMFDGWTTEKEEVKKISVKAGLEDEVEAINETEAADKVPESQSEELLETAAQ